MKVVEVLSPIDLLQLTRRVCELGLQRGRLVETTAERWALAQRLSGVAASSDEPDLFATGGA